jgi:Rod binding domain-containing protein
MDPIKNNNTNNNRYSKEQLSALKKNIQQIAQGQEEQFAVQLIKEMRKTAPSTEEDSSAMNIYKSYLDQEYARSMAEQGSLGVGKSVASQLYRTLGITEGKENE